MQDTLPESDPARRTASGTESRGAGLGRGEFADGRAAGEKLTGTVSAPRSGSLIEWDFWLSFTGYCSFPIILLCKFLGASAELEVN